MEHRTCWVDVDVVPVDARDTVDHEAHAAIGSRRKHHGHLRPGGGVAASTPTTGFESHDTPGVGGADRGPQGDQVRTPVVAHRHEVPKPPELDLIEQFSDRYLDAHTRPTVPGTEAGRVGWCG